MQGTDRRTLIVWEAVAGLVRQGRFEAVLSAGRAELAAPLLVLLVLGTSICERIWPAEPRPVLARGHVQDVCYLVLHAIAVIPLALSCPPPQSGGAERPDVIPQSPADAHHRLYPGHDSGHGADAKPADRPGPDRDLRVHRNSDGRPVPVEQYGSAPGPVLLMAKQLAEPFRLAHAHDSEDLRTGRRLLLGG